MIDALHRSYMTTSRAVRSVASLSILAGAGLASAAAYGLLVLAPLRLDRHPPERHLNLARVFGENGSGLLRYMLTVVLLFALYLCSVAAARRAGRAGAAVALGLAAVFCLLLLPAHPFYSSDVFHYIATSRVWFLHGENPLLIPPAAVPGDPLSGLPDWSGLPSPYGPVWTYLTAPPLALIRGSGSAVQNLVAFKSLAAACGLGAAWLAGATAERLRPGTRASAVVLVAWNPLFVLHVAGDGHNDTAMMLLLSAGMYLAVRGRVLGAGAALALSALVKYASLLVWPLFVMWLLRSERPHRRREALLVVAMLPLLAFVAYLPFWQGWRTLAAARAEGTYFTTSIAAALVPALEMLMSRHWAELLLAAGPRLALLPVLLVMLRRVRDEVSLLSAAALAFLLYLAFASPWFMPWYALWPLLLAAAVPRRGWTVAPVLGLTFGALLLPVATNYLTVMSGEPATWRALNAVGVTIVLAPVFLTWGWLYLAGRHRPAARPADVPSFYGRVCRLLPPGRDPSPAGYGTVKSMAAGEDLR